MSMLEINRGGEEEKQMTSSPLQSTNNENKSNKYRENGDDSRRIFGLLETITFR